ncbi:MAG: amino acid adenylation domain-containing protein [Planctomycetota bacterium]
MSNVDISSASMMPSVTVVSAPKAYSYSTTEAQLEIWLASQQSDQLNCAYNEISSIDLRGSLDRNALRRAIDAVIERHSSLRSTFSEDGQKVFVHARVEVDFSFVDWSREDDQIASLNYARLIESEGARPFDLSRGPLIRFVLQKIDAYHHRLTFNAHHIAMDGWSLSVFCRDLGRIYDGMTEIEHEKLPVADQYDAYAEATRRYQESTQHDADVAFWRDQFSDGIPVLNTPVEHVRPTLKTYGSERYDCFINDSLAEKLRRLGSANGCSLFNTMLTAFTAFVGRLTNTSDLCIGIPTAGQAAMSMRELVGFCVNTMPLRIKPDSSLSFVDLLQTTRTTVLDAFDHQRLAFGTLIRLLNPPRDPSRSPIVDLSFNLDPAVDLSDGGFTELEASVVVEPRCFEKFELFINGVSHRDGSLELQTQFNADLYSREAIETYLQGFVSFLEQVVEEPDRSIREHHLMSLDQRKRVIVDWNQKIVDYPLDSTLHQEFSRQASATPSSIAVEFKGSALTYGDVESSSNQLARYLRSRGVQSGDLVGICVERSEQMLVELLAIMKSGAGYVPLDPAYPVDRLRYMCEHSGLKLVLTHSDLRDVVSKFETDAIEVDSVSSEVKRLGCESLEPNETAEDICYVIYTSGSTGKPKGVQVPHGSVVNFLYSMRKTPGFDEGDSVLAVTTLSFDIAVLELYLPILFGGKVVVVDRHTASSGDSLAHCLEEYQVSMMQATPATWRLLLQANWQGKADLKILCGGEPMPKEIVAPLLDRCGQLWNMYGPTETTVWSTAYRVTSADDPILIGRPIDNTQVYLLDQYGNEVPPGCEGELYIGGAGVTSGYRNLPDQTGERFVRNPYRNPFANYVSDRIYKTGDVARFRNDGNLEFLRRNDKQVKVRGYRIELGEIEQSLREHPAVAQTVVTVREDNPGDTRLVSHWIANRGTDATAADFREFLRDTLPGYMIPQHFVSLDEMPLTNNGKIDFKQLPPPGEDLSVRPIAQSAFTPAESFLVGLCRALLEHDDVELDETFFDLGGHSLLVMQFIAKVDDQAGVKLSPQEFLVKTIRQLAKQLEGCEGFEAGEASGEQAPTIASEPRTTEPIDASGDVSGEAVAVDQDREERAAYLKKLNGFWD